MDSFDDFKIFLKFLMKILLKPFLKIFSAQTELNLIRFVFPYKIYSKIICLKINIDSMKVNYIRASKKREQIQIFHIFHIFFLNFFRFRKERNVSMMKLPFDEEEKP